MSNSTNGLNNRKAVRGLANYIAWSVVLVLTTCGLAGIFLASDLAAVQKVIQAAKEHWPLHIQMPDIPMGPSQLDLSS
ncbi:hypothetical protein GTU79_27225 [Sodalis ligni]|uniref:hypothetical protein n=1 Tax=Sodalis ligni TaxID=2697027 RepID=UPI00193F6877|nr:hypothetical protein [Sodalis ligni]QWA10815.1 hypothetical protein GTU79_27225 [Sodalis ligni]